MTIVSHRVPHALGAVAAAALLLTSCASDDGAKGGDAKLEQSLRRVEIVAPSFVELGTEVVVRLSNAGGGAAAFDGASAEITILGPVPSEEAESADDEGASDGESGEGEESADAADDAAGSGEEAAEDDAGEESADDDAAGADTIDGVTGVAHRGTASGGSVPGGKELDVHIPVTIPLPDDPEALKALLSWRSVRVSIKGEVRRGGSAETFEGVREISLPLFPKVVLNESQVASVDEGAKGATFFTLGIDNPNSFEAVVDTFTYSITVGDKELRPAGEGTTEKIPAGSVETYEESLDLNEETYGKEVKKLLRQPAISYRIVGYQEIRGVQLPFTFEGEMAFAR